MISDLKLLVRSERSRVIREHLATSDPSNADWQRDLAAPHYQLGVIAGRQGREDLLRQHWGEMLAIYAAMRQRGLHVSPADLAGLEKIRAWRQGAAQ
ncbi:hypothetical protein [uncultured Thiodictyon sp.]|uniref:hypothetical protein n=1 Tax=uncultured Thiodictyon sp. TaxID=1846217 RepID=UPI0025EDC180|nr:hypothetical protein [uncultured Thiodictyon sp.]